MENFVSKTQISKDITKIILTNGKKVNPINFFLIHYCESSLKTTLRISFSATIPTSL